MSHSFIQESLLGAKETGLSRLWTLSEVNDRPEFGFRDSETVLLHSGGFSDPSQVIHEEEVGIRNGPNAERQHMVDPFGVQ